MSKIQTLNPVTVTTDENGQSDDVQTKVFEMIAKPNSDGKATVKAQDYEDISLFLNGGIGTKKFKLTELPLMPIPDHPGYTINNLEYLQQFPDIEMLVTDAKKLGIINLTLDMLTSNAKLLWSHFCSLLGLPPISQVAQLFYDKISYEYQFSTIARLVKIYDTETDSNVLRLIVANKYYIPIEYSVNGDGDGKYTINNGKNLVELKIVNAYNEETGQQDKAYPEITIKDKKNGFLNYVISMSLDKNAPVDMETLVENWNEGNIDALPINPPIIPSVSYAKILKFAASNGLMENGIYLFLHSPKLITSGITSGCSNWSVEVPEKFKELQVSTDGNKMIPDDVLGNIDSLLFSKNCPVSTMLKGVESPKNKVVIIIRKFDPEQKASPGMQVLSSASKLCIPIHFRNDPDFMDYVEMNLPASGFAEKPLQLKPSKNYDDDPF